MSHKHKMHNQNTCKKYLGKYIYKKKFFIYMCEGKLQFTVMYKIIHAA